MKGQLKLLAPSKPRLGLYLRPARNDHRVIEQLLAEGRAVSGLVMDARHASRHLRLREALRDDGVHAVLDTNMMELATPGGSVLSGLDDLPWYAHGSATPEEMGGSIGRRLAELIAEFAEAGGYSAVLAPTHLLSAGSDTWFGADRQVVGYLRRALDSRGMRDAAIFYPLAMPSDVLRDPVQLAQIREGLRSAAIDAIWLRLHPFGTANSGPLALKRYIESAWHLQGVGVPLVGERTGTVGLALLAIGAVGGIESGITLGERFDAHALSRPRNPTGTPFSPAPRVYIPEIGGLVTRGQARALFQNRPMLGALGCRDRSCCPNGIDSMISNPRRHFMLRRAAEVDRIGGAPADVRATLYLQEQLRPAVLMAVRAERIIPELSTLQRRLESWNLTLSAMVESGAGHAAMPALGQRMDAARPRPQSLS